MRTLEIPNVVICGIGAVTPIGNLSQNDDSYWQALLSGRTNFKPFQFGDPTQHKITAKVASEFDAWDFSPYASRIPIFADGTLRFRPTAGKLDRSIQLGLAAGLEALEMAGLSQDLTTRHENIGLITGTGLAGGRAFEEGVRIFDARGKVLSIGYTVLNVMLNGLAGVGTIAYGLEGPSLAVDTACASSKHAVSLAFDKIVLGYADAMLVIGHEAVTTAFQLGCFNQMEVLSLSEGPITSKPMGKDRDGLVMGEGAGGLVLAREDYAREHGLPILARILGYGTTSDAKNMVQPSIEGITRCMSKAIANAGLYPGDIHCVNAHATATPTGDGREALAIWQVFNDPELPYFDKPEVKVTATKANLGHTLGAAGILGMIATICSMRNGILPPTTGFELDPKCQRPWLEAGITARQDKPLSIITEKTEADITVSLSNAFGFGGHNCSIVTARPDFRP